MKKIEFIQAYKKHFLNKDKETLIFEMGEDLEGEERLNQVIERFKKIADYLFDKKELWILLIIWKSDHDLVKTGFNIELASDFYDGSLKDGIIDSTLFASGAFEGASISYIKYQTYCFDKIKPLIYSIAGYELALENTTEITAYFISFDDVPILLNLYDDRGMKLISYNSYINSIREKFKQYISFA